MDGQWTLFVWEGEAYLIWLYNNEGNRIGILEPLTESYRLLNGLSAGTIDPPINIVVLDRRKESVRNPDSLDQCRIFLDEEDLILEIGGEKYSHSVLPEPRQVVFFTTTPS